jgi:hypothetical protein
MTLSQIFSAAGKMLSHEISTVGEFPAKRFINTWQHEKGTVIYDENHIWKFIPLATSQKLLWE